MLFCFIFKDLLSLVYLEFNMMCCIKDYSTLIFLYSGIQLPPKHFCESFHNYVLFWFDINFCNCIVILILAIYYFLF